MCMDAPHFFYLAPLLASNVPAFDIVQNLILYKTNGDFKPIFGQRLKTFRLEKGKQDSTKMSKLSSYQDNAMQSKPYRSSFK